MNAKHMTLMVALALGAGSMSALAADLLGEMAGLKFTLVAYNGTPRAIVERLNRELVNIIRSPDMNPVLAGEGASAVGNTPAEFDAVIREDIAKWAKIIQARKQKIE